MKRRLILISLLAVSLFALTACGERDDKLGENEYYIYYLNKNLDGLDKEIYHVKNSQGQVMNLLNECLEQMKKNASDVNTIPALDSSCKVVNYQLNDNKLTLNFDVSYNTMKKIEETLHRGAIVKTLTQIEGIDAIDFNIDGQPLKVEKAAIGFMTGEDFIDSVTGAGDEKTTTVSMYFADKTGNMLVEVPAQITYDTTVPLGQLMIEQLIAGPNGIENIESKQVQATIPKGTELNSYTIRDNVCYLDFNSRFLEVMKQVSSKVTVYSIVNLLAELPNVNKVQFTIDGEQVETYGDGVAFNQPFGRNLDLVVGSGVKK